MNLQSLFSGCRNSDYRLFLIKYPDDELIPSVKYELEGLLEIETIIDSLNGIVSQKKNI